MIIYYNKASDMITA